MGGQVRLLLEDEKEREGITEMEDRQDHILREHEICSLLNYCIGYCPNIHYSMIGLMVIRLMSEGRKIDKDR